MNLPVSNRPRSDHSFAKHSRMTILCIQNELLTCLYLKFRRYSFYWDAENCGLTRVFCTKSYFATFLLVITDESHMTLHVISDESSPYMYLFFMFCTCVDFRVQMSEAGFEIPQDYVEGKISKNLTKRQRWSALWFNLFFTVKNCWRKFRRLTTKMCGHECLTRERPRS